MPRQGNSDNPLRLRVKANSLPPRVTARNYLRRLIAYIDHAEALPRAWDVSLFWQNPESLGRAGYMQEDTFANAIAESSAGFVGIVRTKLVEILRRLPLVKIPPKKKAKKKPRRKKAHAKSKNKTRRD